MLVMCIMLDEMVQSTHLNFAGELVNRNNRHALREPQRLRVAEGGDGSGRISDSQIRKHQHQQVHQHHMHSGPDTWADRAENVQENVPGLHRKEETMSESKLADGKQIMQLTTGAESEGHKHMHFPHKTHEQFTDRHAMAAAADCALLSPRSNFAPARNVQNDNRGQGIAAGGVLQKDQRAQGIAAGGVLRHELLHASTLDDIVSSGSDDNDMVSISVQMLFHDSN